MLKKKLLVQNIQEVCDTMKLPNLRIIGIEEGEAAQLKGLEDQNRVVVAIGITLAVLSGCC